MQTEDTMTISIKNCRRTLGLAMDMAAKRLGMTRQDLLRESLENFFAAEEEAVIELQETLARNDTDKRHKIIPLRQGE